MEVRNNLNSLNQVENAAAVQNRQGQAAPQTGVHETQAAQTDRATLSAAGTGIAQATGETDVRWDKVAGVRQALADGTYDVPASKVASKMVDAMLGKRS